MIDKNIGFIGLGNVGEKLAKNILSSSYKLFIHDLDKKKGKNLIKKGAIWKNSIKEITENSSVVITCLPSPKSVKDVIEKNDGILKFITKNKLWIEMSTTDENEMIRLSKLLKKKGVDVLEAPVTGGQHRAESGNISILTAGKRRVFERALPLLSYIGHKILYCGKLGNASTLKVVTNFLASVNLISLGEALIVCKKYGINLNTAFQGIKISSGNSFVHETESQVILNGSYDVGFTMDLVCKDVNLFNKISKKMKIPTEVSPLLVKVFKNGKKKYGNKSFSTSIVKILEDKCDINLKTKGFPSKLIDLEKKRKGVEVKS